MIAYTLLWPFTSPWRHFLHHFRWWATDIAAVFWMSRNAPHALRDIQKTAARETTDSWELAKILTDSRLDFTGEKPLQVALYTNTVVSK